MAPDGSFAAPAEVGAVTAYVDIDRDGRFDRFAEPSAMCQRGGDGWRCEIPSGRVTVHRTISELAETHRDSTYVSFEQYDAACRPVEGARLCGPERCTQRETAPFFAESPLLVNVMSLCGEEGFAPFEARISDGASGPAIRIQRPAPLAVTITPRPSDAGTLLRLGGDVSGRVLAWAGGIGEDGQLDHVRWTSEDSTSADAEPGGERVVLIPSEQVGRCARDPACVVGAQVLTHQRSVLAGGALELVVISERRMVVDLRGG